MIETLFLVRIGYFLLDNVHDRRVRKRTEITQLVSFACNDLAHDTTHDLPSTKKEIKQVSQVNQGPLGKVMGTLTFPDLVLGKSGTMYTCLGAANGPMTFRTCNVNSLASPASSLGSNVNSLRTDREY